MKEGNLTCGSISSIGGTVTLGEVTASVTCPVGTVTLSDNITLNTDAQNLTEYVTISSTDVEPGTVVLTEHL